MAAKFANIGGRKDKGILDSGLAANDEYFWQEVAAKYQETNESYDELAFDDSMFDGVDPSVRLEHNWSKLREIYKGLTKIYGEVFQNHKKSGNHDDFVNFCGSKGEVYYLHLWLQEKPQLEPLVKLNRVKLDIQISRNYDENVNRLIEVKRKIELETNPGILKVLKKYESA